MNPISLYRSAVGDRASWQLLGMILCIIIGVMGVGRATEVLPLPEWDGELTKQEPMPGVFPASFTPSLTQELSTSTKPADGISQAGGNSRRDSKPLAVDRAFQLFVPEKSLLEGSSPSEEIRVGEFKWVDKEALIRRLEELRSNKRFFYLRDRSSETKLRALERFTKFMKGELGIELCVLMLAEGQTLKSPWTWPKMVEECKDVLLEANIEMVMVVGGSDEFLRVFSVPTAQSSMIQASWAAVASRVGRGLSVGTHQVRVEQVLTRFTSEAMRHVEKPTQSLVTEPKVTRSPEAPMKQLIPPSAVVAPTHELAQQSEAKLEMKPSILPFWDKLLQAYERSPWGMGIMIGMGGLSLMGLAWSWRLKRRALKSVSDEVDDPLKWFGHAQVLEQEATQQEGRASRLAPAPEIQQSQK